MNPTKKGLGRGLSALFGDDEDVSPNAAITPSGNALGPSRVVALSQLEPCPFQPRRNFDNNSLNELAESLKSHGVLQPLLVRPHPTKSGMFEIVAGERRWRAAQRARLHDLPAHDTALLQALDAWGLKAKRHALVRTLSQGQRRRVALARLALSPAGALWVLDEPFDALDATGVSTLLSLMQTHRQSGGSVLFTSHQVVDLPACRTLDLPSGTTSTSGTAP